MPQLDFSTFAAQIVWLFISFAFLYAVLAKWVSPKIESNFFTRETKRQGDLSNAEIAEKNAAELEQSWKKALKTARENAAQRLDEATNSIKERDAKRLQEIHSSLAVKEREAQQKVSALKDEVRAQFPKLVSEVASELLSKTTGKVIEPAAIESRVKIS